jgi:hypothetical protein
MTEYLHQDDLVDELEDQYDEFTREQIELAVDVIGQRYGGDVLLSPEHIDFNEAYGDAVEIVIDDVDDTPIYADPSAGEGEHLCVTWGNLGGELAPEGKATNGDDEDLFGIR